MRYEAILFDLDGTLVDSQKTISRCVNEVLKKHGYSYVNENKISKMIGLPLRELLSRLVEKKILDTCISEYSDLICRTLTLDTKVIDGTLSVLNFLKKMNFKIGIVTTRGIKSTSIIIKEFGMTNFIDVIITEGDVKETKPSEKPLLEAARRLSVPPEKCIYVGDTLDDIIAGKAAGMFTIGISHEIGSSLRLRKNGANMVINKLTDLCNIVLGLEEENLF